MKYKVGDEVLVKVKINYIDRRSSSIPYEVKERNNKKIVQQQYGLEKRTFSQNR